jgi:hypothetical protein
MSKLMDQGSKHVIKSLLVGVVEIKVEVKEAGLDLHLEMIDDRGTQNCLPTTSKSRQQEKRISFPFPLDKIVMLKKPKAGILHALRSCVIMIYGNIRRPEPTFNSPLYLPATQFLYRDRGSISYSLQLLQVFID